MTMSDNNIPFEIEREIMKTLPVKSLLRFRSVSKAWKCVIDSSDFIDLYSNQQTQRHHLLVIYNDGIFPQNYFHWKYISVVDDDEDDTFPQLKEEFLHLPRSLTYHHIIGCSHGLLCLHRKGFGATDIVVLWNISIQKGVSVAVPNAGHKIYETVLGFGVCRVTSDLKIVKIRYKSRLDNVESISCIPWQVEVFTLSTRAWRSPYSNLPRKSIQFRSKQVAIDGLVYWLAYDMIAMDVRYNCRYCNLIISFDMTTEEFKEVNLPNSLAQQPFYYLSLSKIRESLVVLGRGVCGNNRVFGVWMMEDGVSSSFRMLFNVDVNAPYASIMGFRKSGEAIIEISKHEHDHAQHVVYDPCTDPKCDYARLVVYEPYSKRMDNLGFEGVKASFFVYPYVETLLLLDQPDLTSSYEYI